MKISQLAIAAVALCTATAAPAQGPEFAGEPLRFNHFMVAISVADIERESAWFTENLGFTVVTDTSMRDGAVRFRWLVNGNERIELIQTDSQPGTPHPAPPGHAAIRGFSQLTLETDDINAVRASLAANGITPVLDITEVAVLGIKVMYLVDPEGNPIEIAQRL